MRFEDVMAIVSDSAVYRKKAYRDVLSAVFHNQPMFCALLTLLIYFPPFSGFSTYMYLRSHCHDQVLFL